MDVITATRQFETWLAGLVSLYPPDLDYKHRQMAHPSNPFPFFRGTYYLWVRHWAEAAGGLADSPSVLAVGDLHVENYGSWRDADGRLCWGVNDFDEAERLPYTNDLVRLAASVRFVRKAGAIAIKTRGACAAILAGYRETLEEGGKPYVLEERHPRLRALAMQADRDPTRFWKKLTSLLNDPPVDPPEEARAGLLRQLPAEGLSAEFRFRPRVGMGSLGKPRYVALAQWAGSWVAREAKALTPPATDWAAGRSSVEGRVSEVTCRAIRAHDPYYRPEPNWILRRLGPRCSRIELDQLLRGSDLPRLLRAMGAEAANVHLGTPGVAQDILADLAARPAGWLVEASRSLGHRIEQDWIEWRKAYQP